jgi:DNA helicase HerA-like ATPase
VTELLGREGGDGPTAHLGRHLARDGSVGGRVTLDLDRPHASLVVGKRGYGKSYTLGVLAEELTAAAGVTGVVVDPMGVFDGLAEGAANSDDAPARVVREPAVRADALPPEAWCSLLDLAPTSAAGALVWRVATDADTLAEMREGVEAGSADSAARRAARNHLDLAASWGVFDPGGLTAADLLRPGVSVLDCSALGDGPTGAVVRGVASALYRAAVEQRVSPLPWLLVDEAHAAFDGVARPALETLLTRGRGPGVSLVCATQRPGALPSVAISQADMLVAHRLTAESDLDALAAARPAYLQGSLADRLPARPGEAVVVDDATETAHTVRVRERETPHGGGSPRASARIDSETVE